MKTHLHTPGRDAGGLLGPGRLRRCRRRHLRAGQPRQGAGCLPPALHVGHAPHQCRRLGVGTVGLGWPGLGWIGRHCSQRATAVVARQGHLHQAARGDAASVVGVTVLGSGTLGHSPGGGEIYRGRPDPHDGRLHAAAWQGYVPFDDQMIITACVACPPPHTHIHAHALVWLAPAA